MQAAAQASAYGYRGAESVGSRGFLGPATSLGIAGAGFPTLDASAGEASVCESAVLDAAADAAAAQAASGGGTAFLDLRPFMHVAPMTGWCRVGG